MHFCFFVEIIISMKIIISKSEVYKEVEKQSSIAASVLIGADSPRYEDVRVTEYDYEVLDTFWRDGVNSAIQLFTRYISNQTVSSDLSTFDGTENLTIGADMPDAFNDLLIGSITTGLKMMLSCNVMSGWMGIKVPNTAQKYKNDALGYANDIKIKLLYRSAPAQNRSSDFESDTVVESSSDYFQNKPADTVIQNEEDYFSTKSADTNAEHSDDYFSEKSADIVVASGDEYFQPKSADTGKEQILDYFGIKDSDTNTEKGEDYFSTKQADTITDSVSDYFGSKGNDTIVEVGEDYFNSKSADTQVEKGDEYFVEKQADTSVERSPDFFGVKESDTVVERREDYVVVKDEDNLILEQYENCNNHP